MQITYAYFTTYGALKHRFVFVVVGQAPNCIPGVESKEFRLCALKTEWEPVSVHKAMT